MQTYFFNGNNPLHIVISNTYYRFLMFAGSGILRCAYILIIYMLIRKSFIGDRPHVPIIQEKKRLCGGVQIRHQLFMHQKVRSTFLLQPYNNVRGFQDPTTLFIFLRRYENEIQIYLQPNKDVQFVNCQKKIFTPSPPPK